MNTKNAIRALIVEDEALVALMLADMLSDLDVFVVGVASDLKKAISMAHSETVNFAILDLKLSGDETYEVADILTARSLPFAFATGYGRDRLLKQDRHCPILQKPFDIGELRNTISELCKPITG